MIEKIKSNPNQRLSPLTLRFFYINDFIKMVRIIKMVDEDQLVNDKLKVEFDWISYDDSS